MIRKRWMYLLAFAGAILVVGRERHALAASLVESFDFQQQGGAYFAPSLSAGERTAALGALPQARARVRSLYGALRAQPRLIFSDATHAARLGVGTTGVAHYRLNGASLVFGPQGRNVDVIAHELAHAELHARLGLWRITACVPTWFDEGLAVQFDTREPFGSKALALRIAQGWHTPRFADLATTRGFFAGSRDQVRFHYAATGVAMKAWLDAKGHDAALKFIEALACDDRTAEELQRIER